MNTTNLSILELMDIHIVFLGINYNSANELSNGNENTDPPLYMQISVGYIRLE